MRKGHSRGRDILSLALFGPGLALVYYAASRVPLGSFSAGHHGLTVACTVLWVVLAAYGWRRMVVAFLRVCGFG
jgi:hypothetical protein